MDQQILKQSPHTHQRTWERQKAFVLKGHNDSYADNQKHCPNERNKDMFYMDI